MGRTIRTCSALAALVGVVAASAAQANDYAAFGKARIAAANGNVTTAAEQYRIALTTAPTSQIIAQRAFRQAMAAGDLALARRAVTAMGADAPYDARLLALADAIKAGDAKAIEAALAGLDKTPIAFFQPIVRAWLNVGTTPDPAATLAVTTETGAIRHVVMENRALLLIAQNDINGAATVLEDELSKSSGGLDLRYAAAELLKGQGREPLARQLLAGNASIVASVREQLPSTRATPTWGVSRLFSRIAADLSDVNIASLSVSFARSALVLDPANDRARILLAAALDRMKAYDRALATLDEVKPGSAFRFIAQADRIGVLSDKGDMVGGLVAAKAFSTAAGADAESALIYGNMLTAADRPLDAAKAYELARDRRGVEAGWQVWLQIGSAYEKAGRWPDARTAFEKSLALDPEQAVTLNAFGYALVERGQDLPRAITMLEKANGLAPGQPAIADSLALAYFRNGDVAKALPLLEAASVQSPADPEIAEHLGDVYWAAGRRYEARYSWRAARLVAEPNGMKRLDAKILNGPAPAAS